MKGIILAFWVCSIFIYAQSPGDIIITEVMQDPADVSFDDGEWFEIYNNTNSDIDINGWRIRDDDSDIHDIDAQGPLIIQANDFLVFSNNSNSMTNGGFLVDYQFPSGFNLANTDDELIIEAPGAIEIDRIEWDGGSNWPDPTGASMVLTNFQADNNNGANWTEATVREPNYEMNGNSDKGSPGTLGSDQSLPVELTSFTATAGDGQVTLRWVTASEINNMRFDIMRALEPEGGYTQIGSKEGQFNSNQRTEYDFTDPYVSNGVTYWYKIVDVDVNGVRTEHGPRSATPRASGGEVVTLTSDAPEKFVLYPGYPNPFNPAINLKFDIPRQSDGAQTAVLEVYNTLGQKVRTLFNGILEAGSHAVSWDGRADSGKILPGGVYYAILRAGYFRQAVKMTYLK